MHIVYTTTRHFKDVLCEQRTMGSHFNEVGSVCVLRLLYIIHPSRISLPHTTSIMVKGQNDPPLSALPLLMFRFLFLFAVILVMPVPRPAIIHTLLHVLFWTWKFSTASCSQKWEETLKRSLNWDVTLMCLHTENQLAKMQRVTETAAGVIFAGDTLLFSCSAQERSSCLGVKTQTKRSWWAAPGCASQKVNPTLMVVIYYYYFVPLIEKYRFNFQLFLSEHPFHLQPLQWWQRLRNQWFVLVFFGMLMVFKGSESILSSVLGRLECQGEDDSVVVVLAGVQPIRQADWQCSLVVKERSLTHEHTPQMRDRTAIE